MTVARALIHADGYAMWHDGILDPTGELFAYHAFVRNQRVARVIPVADINVVSNRVLLPMINEAIYCLYEGVGTPEAIDEVMKLGMNHPLGPLALADLIGLDVCLDILRVLHAGLGDSKYRPCPLLVKMVDAGRLGRKTGRGFHQY